VLQVAVYDHVESVNKILKLSAEPQKS
jgi:hypothetical protein